MSSMRIRLLLSSTLAIALCHFVGLALEPDGPFVVETRAVADKIRKATAGAQ